MSLLMDALRRAEAEKQAAAAREAPTLEETLPEHFDLRLEPEPERISPRERSARRPDAHELERVLDMGSDDPTLADEFMLDSRVAPPAPDLATLGRPERVTPQTVFAAGRQPLIGRQTLGLAAAALLGLVSLGVLSWRMLGEPRAVTPLASLELPPTEPLSEQSKPALPDEAFSGAESMRPGGVAPAAKANPDRRLETRAVDAAPPSSVNTATESEPVSDAVGGTMTTTPSAAMPSQTAPREAGSSDRGSLSGTQREVSSAAAPSAKEAIVIARASPAATQVNTRLEDAYAAWRGGDLGRARAGYERVLATTPRSVDAQLGLGAIALREGQPQAARDHYARALELAPGNAVATAAIFLIDAGEGDARTAERLLQLSDSTDPYVQFALGNHHARSGRWVDAQRAYREASNADPGNADYAFNLAVSLDQLGQRAAARTWYTRALALHQPEHRFDPAVARARLATLSAP